MEQPFLSLKLSPKTKLRIQTLGLVGNLLEDTPQLVVQALLVARTGRAGGVLIASMVASCVNVLFEIVRRILLATSLVVNQKYRGDSRIFMDQPSGTHLQLKE